MVKLIDTKGKPIDKIAGGAYARCFGDLALSRLLSRVQSLIIKNGYELEAIVTDLVADSLIDDLDDFLQHQIMRQGIRVAEKKVIRRSKTIQGHGIEPDFIIFERVKSTQNCYILELKDGHEFDTKSSAKEQTNLYNFLSRNTTPLQYFQTYCKICGFNADTNEEIRTGFKNKIALTEAMTGRELCNLLGLDYDEIVANRANDRVKNFDQFLDDLIAIDTVRTVLKKKYQRLCDE